MGVKNSRRVNQFRTLDIKQYRSLLQSGEPARIHFEYPLHRGAALVEVSAPVVWIPYHFGLRPFFECPVCGRRCCLLYMAEVCACRQCLRLAYPVQFETKLDQGFRRAWKARRKAAPVAVTGDFLGGDIPGWRKPIGMHWRTFYRLREQAALSAETAFGRLIPIEEEIRQRLERNRTRRQA